MSGALIAARGLCLERGGRTLLRDFDLNMGAGELLLVEGANGSGKTTLLRALAGLSRLGVRGEVQRAAVPVLFLGHRLGIKQLLSPRENLQWFCDSNGLGGGGIDNGLPTGGDGNGPPADSIDNALAGGSTDSDLPAHSIDNALARVGLRGCEDVLCQNLSAGQQRRVGWARLLLSDAPLWILDEPFAAIDRAGVRGLANVLETGVRAGACVLMSSHQDIPLDIPLRRVAL